MKTNLSSSRSNVTSDIPTGASASGPTILLPDQWKKRWDAHRATVHVLTKTHRERSSRHERHPVWDFIFHYYPVTPGKLSRWSPGQGVYLLDAPSIKYFAPVGVEDIPSAAFDNSNLTAGELHGHTITTLDTAQLWGRRGKTLSYVENILARTLAKPPHFDCFGLHEWAMVYKGKPRHPEPLRLGVAGTNDVVETHSIRCTHYDAYRFFTPSAGPRNQFHPRRETQPLCEQGGCLHANMDLYKWATKLETLVPGELWLDTFRLACDIRKLDMRASPYDLTAWGFTPVPIETPQGKAHYVSAQREFHQRAHYVRNKLLSIIRTSHVTL